jgi:hypothetical protein
VRRTLYGGQRLPGKPIAPFNVVVGILIGYGESARSFTGMSVDEVYRYVCYGFGLNMKQSAYHLPIPVVLIKTNKSGDYQHRDDKR